jgi:hypothetical protein
MVSEEAIVWKYVKARFTVPERPCDVGDVVNEDVPKKGKNEWTAEMVSCQNQEDAHKLVAALAQPAVGHANHEENRDSYSSTGSS